MRIQPKNLLVALVSLAACEPSATRSAPPQVYPSPYAMMPPPGWPQAPPPQLAQAPAPPPIANEGTRPPRSVDATIDGSTSFRLPAQDVRDPWERELPRAREVATPAVPQAPELPKTYLLIVIDADEKGAPSLRLAAARTLLAEKGALKRAESTWEIPVFAEDRAPYGLASELSKTLCNEDRLALFFLSEGRLVKLEMAGTAACETPKRR